MSEADERNLEGATPETAEKIESEAENVAASGAASSGDTEGAPAPEAQGEDASASDAQGEEEIIPTTPMEPEAGEESDEESEEESDEEPEEEAKPKKKSSSGKGGKKKKKRARRSAVVPLAIALVAVLVIFGVLVGYGLGRIRSERGREEQPQAGEPAAQSDEAPAYDAFTEALTQENQQALDDLSGADEFTDADVLALLGEDDFFEEEFPEDSEPAGEPVVVAEFGDGQTLMSDEVLEAYNEELATYILSGYNEDEVAEMLLDDVLHTMVADRVMEAHAREMGLCDLTDEDREAIAAEAATYGEDGASDEALIAQLEQDWWKNKLFDALTSSVTVDEATVRATYDERLAEQMENFTAYPEDFEFSQHNGETILYNLPGYRAVKVLQLGFDDEEAAMAVYALTDELYTQEGEGAASDPQRQAELDGYYAGPEARAKEALEQLRGGADMDELILSIGQDEGMLDDRQRAQGYYVCAESTMWSEEFVAAAMALKNVGDYSEPVRTEDGVCILQYLGEVSEGEVPFEDVRDALELEALDTARSDAYETQVQAWVEAANPSYYPDRMQ